MAEILRRAAVASAVGRHEGWPKAALLAVFFLSGANGLVYEITWTRLIRHVMGNTTFTVTTVLCAFMGGLAIGGWWGGWLADRRNDQLRWFAAIECLIGAYCFCLPTLISCIEPINLAICTAHWMSQSVAAAARVAICFALLLIPASFMGATLPLLSRFIARSADAAALEVSRLHGINSLGAAAGCLAAGFLLIPALGMQGTLNAAVISSLLVSAVAWALRRYQPASQRREIGAGGGPTYRTDSGWPLQLGGPLRRALLVGYAVAGAAAMLYEIAWTRTLTMLVGSTVYAFSLMLTVFILGLSIGSLVSGRWAGGVRQPARALGFVQGLIGMSALSVVPLVDRLPVFVTTWIMSCKGSFWQQQLVQCGVVLAVMFVPTVLMGVAFPLANQVFLRTSLGVGKSVGTVFAWNTVGCIVGCCIGGFLLIPTVGIQRTLFVAVFLNLGVGAALLAITEVEGRLSRTSFAAWALIVPAVTMWLLPAWDASRMSLGPVVQARRLRSDRIADVPGAIGRAADADIVLLHEEGVTTTITVKERPTGDRVLLVDGKPDASTITDDMVTQELLAHVPLLLHPMPRSVLVIGLASGITLGSAGCHPVDRLTCVELAPEMLSAAMLFEDWNRRILDDPRVEIIINDARNHLLVTNEKYDVIISEPSNPWIAGVADLFTLEFFRLCRSRLSDDGIACLWLETYNMDSSTAGSIIRTFESVFPEMSIWMTMEQDLLLIGNAGTPVSACRIVAERMGAQDVAEDLARIGIRTVPEFFSHRVTGAQGARRLAEGCRIHTDDNALLEFSTPRSMMSGAESEVFRESIARAYSEDMSCLDCDGGEEQAGHLKEASKIRTARRHALIGSALAAAGRSAEARDELRVAAAANRTDPVLRRLLTAEVARVAALSVEPGQSDEAVRRCEELRRIDPQDPWLNFVQGGMLLAQGKYAAARDRLTIAVAESPRAEVHLALAAALNGMEEFDEAEKHYREAIALEPDNATALNDLAWLLATGPRRTVASAEAVSYAEKACAVTRRQAANLLDTLSVAYANSGQFVKAKNVALEAILVAEKSGSRRLVEMLRSRLDNFSCDRTAKPATTQ